MVNALLEFLCVEPACGEVITKGRDGPVSWHLAVIRSLVHAASAELQSGRLSEAEVERTIVTTVLAAIRP